MFFFFSHKLTFAQENEIFPTQCFCPKSNTSAQNLNIFPKIGFFSLTLGQHFCFYCVVRLVTICTW